MIIHNKGELPAVEKKIDAKLAVEAQQYTKHYLNHRKADTPGWEKNKKKKYNDRIIDCIIKSHSKYHTGDYNYNDKKQDLEATAYLIVYESALRYVTNEKYKNKFDFCKFASCQLKWGLQKYIYDLNTKRLNGSLPDSDYIRKLFYRLPKDKNQLLNSNKNTKNEHLDKISSDLNINREIVTKVDNTLTNYTISGNQTLDNESNETFFDIIKDENEDLENELINKDLVSRTKKLIANFLKTLPSRDREIVDSIKFKEKENLKKLSNKYNISYERTRQIAEKNYLLIKNYLKKNLENNNLR